MANEQHDGRYWKKTFGRAFIVIAAVMALGMCVVSQIDGETKHFSKEGWVLLSIWVGILVAGVVWITAVARNYRCPKCGTPLRKRQEAATKYEVRFHCDRCHVTWTTGVYPGDG